jgi:hypothetical protein
MLHMKVIIVQVPQRLNDFGQFLVKCLVMKRRNYSYYIISVVTRDSSTKNIFRIEINLVDIIWIKLNRQVHYSSCLILFNDIYV